MGKENTALEVIVDQKPGVINWNFEQLKVALAAKIKEYDGLVYTEETVPAAKTDVAALRKLKKAVSDKRIEIKKKCLEPYDVIEKQANELTELIDKPIKQIAAQLDDYEKQRKEAVKKEIMEFMQECFDQLPADISKKLQIKVYDEKWENASTSKKTWKTAITDARKVTLDDINVLDNIEEDLREDCKRVYGINLVLSEALIKAEELRKQKEQILARERERIAAEERRKAEEEARRAQEAADAPNKEVEVVEAAIVQPEEETVSVEPTRTQEEAPTGWVPGAINPPEEEKGIYTLRISATPSQIAKIKGYIEYTGAVYREV